MTLLKINLDPDRKTLLRFGLSGLAIFGLLGAWVHGSHSFLFRPLEAGAAASAARGLWIAAAACGLLGWLAPRAIRVLYVGVSLVALPIGYLVSHAVVFLLYYGIVVPMALLVRLCGGDPLSQRRGRPAGWRERREPPDPHSYYRQS